MRRLARVLLIALGTVLCVAGLAAVLLTGTDDTIGTGEHEITTDTAVLTTSTSVLSFMGPTLHASASAPASDEPIFLGVGHPVDVGDYLDGVAHDQIHRIDLPWSPQIHRSEGPDAAPAVAPGTRDWWYASAAGPGRQDVSAELGAEPMRLVVMRAGAEAPVTIDLELGLQVDGLFTTALLVLGAGIVLLAVAVVALRRRPRRRDVDRSPSGDEAWGEVVGA